MLLDEYIGLLINIKKKSSKIFEKIKKPGLATRAMFKGVVEEIFCLIIFHYFILVNVLFFH